MTTLQTEVLVVGGGATGAGIAWDAALRGYEVILVDRADLAEGTSGRFHGLLHSGGRSPCPTRRSTFGSSSGRSRTAPPPGVRASSPTTARPDCTARAMPSS